VLRPELRKEAIVRRLNFCEWTDTEPPWIDRDKWEACQVDFDPADLAGMPCTLGLDLSSKRDLTAMAACWSLPDGTRKLAAWFWSPGDVLEEKARADNVPYPVWRDAGHLFSPPGRIIDKRHMAMFVQQLVAGRARAST